MENQTTTRTRKATAVLACCANHKHWKASHGGMRSRPERLNGVIRGTIMYCDIQSKGCTPRAARFALAADRLRDFLTVESVCQSLGITRADIKPEPCNWEVAPGRPEPCHCGAAGIPRGNGVEDICAPCFAAWDQCEGTAETCPRCVAVQS